MSAGHLRFHGALVAYAEVREGEQVVVDNDARSRADDRAPVL